MQAVFKNSSEPHYWIIVFWCMLGAVILGGIAVISYWIRRCRKAKHIMKKLYHQNGLKRSNSAIEFDVSALSAANRRQIYSGNRSASSEQDNSDHSEHSEKSPLVSARLDNLARLFFSKSMPAETGSRDTIESVLTTRPNLKYQYSALDSGNGVIERSSRERAYREHAFNATQEWAHNSNGRYEVIAHLDEIGSRHSKNWFLINDSSVRTDRLMTLLQLPPDCVVLDDLPENESPRAILMELLGSLHHPYVYPVLDLGLLRTASNNYACLVTPFNSRGSLKDLIYKTQWNEPWARKYTRKPNGLPASQVQRLGRQILEALLFLKERGFPLHGHLHSGNVILQNGAARLSGLENGLLGLSSRVNAVMWSRSTTEIENVDIICFGHLLYEMCTGLEMTTPKPSMRMLEMELDRYPQILDILSMIFEPPGGVCPSVEELVLCDLFRSIDLRELRGPCFTTIKPSLSRSTLNLLQAVKKRQVATLGNSLSETNSPCTPPSTPRDRRSGTSRTIDSFDILSDCEDGLLDEIVVGYHEQCPKLVRTPYQHKPLHYQNQHVPDLCDFQHLQPCQQFQKHHQQQRTYDPLDSPIHFCDNSDEFGESTEEQIDHNSQVHNSSRNINSHMKNVTVADFTSCGSSLSVELISNTPTNNSNFCNDDNSTEDQPELDAVSSKELHTSIHNEPHSSTTNNTAAFHQYASHNFANTSTNHSSSISAAAMFNNQLSADICGLKNSKSRRLEYSLKCLKYGRSNPSQDSAFGSLTDGDLSTGSSSFRLSSFQSISSPIDEGVEDIIIATTGAGKETCLELATIPKNLTSQDSAISSPCREASPNNFLTIDDAPSGCCSAGSSSSGSSGHVRPQHLPISLSPKILVTATTNSSNSSLASTTNVQQLQQFDPPKILVNDQNSIYTTSPSKRSGTIEVFSQKYRVSSFEDMSPNKRSLSAGSGSSSGKHLKHTNRMVFRSLEEERRIDSAFMPIKDRTNSENRVNMQNEKYKKLTHASFRISKTSSQISVMEGSHSANITTISPSGSTSEIASGSDELEVRCNNKQLRPQSTSSSRQALWRDSKFYRKNRIAKSNDSLLETSPHHSSRLSPSSLQDNHYDCFPSYNSAHSSSRQSLNRGCSVNEITSPNQNIGVGVSASNNFYGSPSISRRYCTSKSEDLGEENDYLQVINARKSSSERHLVSLTRLKQTAFTSNMDSNEQSCPSENDFSFNKDNNHHKHYNTREQQHHQVQFLQKQHQQLLNRQQCHHQYPQPHFVRPHPNHFSLSSSSINRITTTKIRTTSLATLSCHQDPLAFSPSTTESAESCPSKTVPSTSFSSSSYTSFDNAVNYEDSVEIGQIVVAPNDDNSSTDESYSPQILSSAELSKIFSSDGAQGSSCSEEKTPLLDSVEMSPISPTTPTKLGYNQEM